MDSAYLPGHIQLGRTAALVSLSVSPADSPLTKSEEGRNTIREAGKRLAMHIVSGGVAANPQYIDAASVPQDVLLREKTIIKELMVLEEQKAAEAALAKGKGSKGSGGGGKFKSEEVIAKALAGKLNKRLAEICLYTQNHLAEPDNPVVSKYLTSLSASLSKSAGVSPSSIIEVNQFERWAVGQEAAETK
eukprot:gene1567-1819_t